MRTLLITGAGSGIGAGLVEHLAAAGHHIIASDLQLEAVQALADRLAPAPVIPLALDVGDPAAIERICAALPPVDVLINNAGLQHVARLEEFPPEKWAQLIQVMLIGPALLSRALLPGMRERNFGRVINIGSIHSLVASPFKSAYVAAKHGLLGFSKVLALETADCDITFNTICPTYVKTPLVDRQIAATAKEYGISEAEVVSEIMLKPMPKNVFISLQELADVAQFLISDSARNITGQTLTVDGGWTAR